MLLKKSKARLENRKQELADQFFHVFPGKNTPPRAKSQVRRHPRSSRCCMSDGRTLRNLVQWPPDANFGKTLETSQRSWLGKKTRNKDIVSWSFGICTSTSTSGRRDNQARTATAQELPTRFFSGWRKCYGYHFHGFCVFSGLLLKRKLPKTLLYSSTQIMPTNSDTFCTSPTNTAAHCSSSVTHAHTKQSGLDASSATDPSTKT